MKIKKSLNKLPLIFVLTLVFISCSETSDLSVNSNCEKLELLAENQVKTKELKVWFSNQWALQNFRELFSQTTDIYALGNPNMFSQIDINWGNYGINSNLASISISNKSTDKSTPYWVSFGDGRDAVYLDLHVKSKLSETAEKLEKWKKVKDGVYLFCD